MIYWSFTTPSKLAEELLFLSGRESHMWDCSQQKEEEDQMITNTHRECVQASLDAYRTVCMVAPNLAVI